MRVFFCMCRQFRAQTVTNFIDSFDPSGIGANTYSTGKITNIWKNWFGRAFQSVSWDAAMDANTNASSGSLKIAASFGGSANQFEVWLVIEHRRVHQVVIHKIIRRCNRLNVWNSSSLDNLAWVFDGDRVT